MTPFDRVAWLRKWLPIPIDGVHLRRWILLEGSRFAVIAALLTVTFLGILVLGTVWTFELHRLLSETGSVQTLLNTILGGIILLVSIVVSINSIVLSYDITSIGHQETRVREANEFRQELGALGTAEQNPTDPTAFLKMMATVIHDRTDDIAALAAQADGEAAADLDTFVGDIRTTTAELEGLFDRVRGSDFGTLWIAIDAGYGRHMDQLRTLEAVYAEQLPEGADERFDQLIEALELFATGEEYFKTLYYQVEVSELSRTLLIVALPTILLTAWTTLAIDSSVMPEIPLFGLPPLLTFLGVTFVVSLAPFLVLTAYILRLATVAHRTPSAGPFTLDR